MRIDMHTHLIPPDWPDPGHGPWPRLTAGEGGRKLLEIGTVKMVLDERFWSARRRIEDMDRIGLDMQVLSPIPLMACYGADAHANRSFARRLNEHIAETVAEFPRRFCGMATVPLQDPDLAIAELPHLRATLDFRAVQIGTCPAGRELDDPALIAFLTAARDLDMAVFVHPSDPVLGAERMAAYYLRNIIGNPLESTLAMARLICGGVLDLLPGLRICFAHAGGAFPCLLGRLDQGAAVRAETRAKLGRKPSDYASMIYVDSLSFDAASLRLAVEKHGVERLLLGSDYPFALGETDPLATLGASGLDAATTHRIAATNVLEFLGLVT